MLWLCEFTWQSGTTVEKVRQRVLQQHQAGLNHPERIKAWYNLAGGGAGLMIVEMDDPRQLTEMLQPYMDLVDWDVHGIYELNYDEVIQAAQQAGQTAGVR